MFRRCTMSSLLKEVRAALQPQIPDVAGSLLRRLLVGSLRAGESHPGRNLGRLDLQALTLPQSVCPSGNVTGFGKGITWVGFEFV